MATEKSEAAARVLQYGWPESNPLDAPNQLRPEAVVLLQTRAPSVRVVIMYVGPRLAAPPSEVARDVRRLQSAWPEVVLVPVICTSEEDAELPRLLGMVCADKVGCLQPRLKIWILAACRVPWVGGRPCTDGS